MKGKGTLHVVTLDCWKERIVDLIKLFNNISFSHVYREDNQEVDSLSKQDLQKQPRIIAYYLCEEGHQGPTMFLNLY